MTSRSSPPGPRPSRGRTSRLVVGAIGLAALAAGLWWSGWPPFRRSLPFGAASRLNVLLVTLDTTRADRLGAYGFSGVQTPVLDRLAADGVVFERAVTSAPLTLPAHTSIMTGLYPPRHGVRDNGGFFVSQDTVTLAETLKGQGYRTGAFVGAYVLDSRWGLDQGFDTYVDDFDLSAYESPTLATVERPGNEVVDRATAWLETALPAAPFFAWVHFYDPHSPYRAPEPYGSVYVRQPYLGEIAFVDAQIGRLVSYLAERGLAERTLVVVVGDHGESLGEHGEGTHGFFLYESTTRVPLIVRVPGSGLAPRRVPTVVRTVDIVPTLLDVLGLPPADRIDGRSLAPLMRGEATDLGLQAYAEAFYPRLHFGWSELLSLHAGGVKYIAAPRPEVYDLAADPAESRNLFDQRRDEAEQAIVSLRALERVAAAGAPQPAAVDAETRRRLTALGYVASFAAAPPADATNLADPKDKVELFTLMTRAQELTQHRRNGDARDEVTALLSQVVARDASVIDAWLMLGNERSRRRDFEGAIADYRRALALKPDYDLAVIGLARAYRALGRRDDALVGYRRFLERDAGNAQVRFELAQTLLDAGDLEPAEAELRHLLEGEPTMAAARHALGAVWLERGRTTDAEREIRAALATRPAIRMAHFHLALIAEGKGLVDEAMREYRAEVAQFPDNHMAHFNLGKLFEQRGDSQAQLEAFRRAIDANAEFAEGHLFLAKLLLDLGRDTEEALQLATRGRTLAPNGAHAPLGHYLAAEALVRLGRPDEARREVAQGKTVASRLSSGRRR
ncbi:MAG: sulfatase-like hydrolase/transferase [Vicinamibacterales bacterium]